MKRLLHYWREAPIQLKNRLKDLAMRRMSRLQRQAQIHRALNALKNSTNSMHMDNPWTQLKVFFFKTYVYVAFAYLFSVFIGFFKSAQTLGDKVFCLMSHAYGAAAEVFILLALDKKRNNRYAF